MHLYICFLAGAVSSLGFSLSLTSPERRLSPRPLRLSSQATPEAGRISDLGTGTRTSVISRISGIGQVNNKENWFKLSNVLNAVAQRPYEHSPWRCLRGCRGFHITWIKVMIIHISTTGSSTSTCDRRAAEQSVCEDDEIYAHLCVSGLYKYCNTFDLSRHRLVHYVQVSKWGIRFESARSRIRGSSGSPWSTKRALPPLSQRDAELFSRRSCQTIP